MEELKKLIKENLVNPFIALLIVIVLIQSWVVIGQLDTMNNTLKDIYREVAITKQYVMIVEGEDKKIGEVIMPNTQGIQNKEGVQDD